MKQNLDSVKMEASWKALLGEEFAKPYMQELKSFLVEEKRAGKEIYPLGCDYFNAFNLTPVGNVKVVILGQDPYHGPGQAHGLCFSVRPGVKMPPSLVNIFKELSTDLGVGMPDHGCLIPWVRQGVFLLNSVLTVEKGMAASHQNRGWERFTDRVIFLLNEKQENLVFLLWGSYAQKKGSIIDPRRHLVLRSVHPSPLSAHRGFMGCRHFSRANSYLAENGKEQIDWRLPLVSEL